MENQDVSAEMMLVRLWPWLEANKNRIIGVITAIVVLAGIYSFISWRHQQAEISAGEAFTQLVLTPPAATPQQTAAAFEVLAAQYAGTQTAARSQLQAATILFEAGSYADAQAQFQKFVDSRVGGNDMTAAAQLGVGTCLESLGQLDAAAIAYEKVIALAASSTSATPAEYGMGRIAEAQGKLESAESYYEHAASAGQAGGELAREAYGHMMTIKAKLAAAQKTTAPATPTLSPSIPLSK